MSGAVRGALDGSDRRYSVLDMTLSGILLRRLTVGLVVWLTLALPAFADDKLVVFAAASLQTALDSAAAAYHAQGGGEVAISYGGSLALARQIVAGAPADLFASADEPSMDEAVKGGAIRAGTRIDLLSNRLVVVAPRASAINELPLNADALGRAIGEGRVATGEVNTVPIGKYAKASLTKLGLWDVVEPHLAMTDNVRAALAFVARAEAVIGIVYATDAAADSDVKIVATLPADSHPPITYPFAITQTSHNPAAETFLKFLESPAAGAIFKGQGFGLERR
jgi:molybdate transport system substrate-binding protein